MKTLNIPKHGWKVKLNHDFPQKRAQKLSVTFRQVIAMLPLSIRYLWYWIKKWIFGLKPIMDFIRVAKNYEYSGVPLGGIGGGTISRGFKGEFYNYHMLPGMYDPEIAEAMHFIVTVQDINKSTIYQSVLTGYRQSKYGPLATWEWNFPPDSAEYTALYPRSWTVYEIPDLDITLVCRQISPVIPHNYKDTCIPGGVFEWVIYNNSSDLRYVSITFTMNNSNKRGELYSELFEENNSSCKISGVMLHEENDAGKYSISLAGLKNEHVSVTKCPYFDPSGDGYLIWNTLKKNGELSNLINKPNSVTDGKLGVAVCCTTLLNGDSMSSLSFSIIWDMPYIKFPAGKRKMKRYYTKYFSDSGKIGPSLCLYSLNHYTKWEEDIEKWQSEILESDVPDWYKSAIFNELYYVSNGGSIWVLLDEEEKSKLAPDDPRLEYGRFGYLEGLEYRMYNTYDVHFYASAALTMLWPKLQLSLQYDARDSVNFEDTSKVWYLFEGNKAFRKTKGTVPHDFGDAGEDPYCLINGYPVHDVSCWRDLNLKFVLQVYRDYIVIKCDEKYISDMFNEMTTVMRRALQWDIDGDGMIENSGRADQTYDTWVMYGTSAYCGSLWLAAVKVYVEMANILNKTEIVKEFTEILEKAKMAFDKKLWCGNYYKFDSSNGDHSHSIMADQLCGLWYLHCCGVKDLVLPEAKIKKALSTIYNYNVCSYYDGNQGAVNGMFPDFNIDSTSLQSEEVWTGVTYALASLFYYQNMKSEAFKTAEGIYSTVYEKSGLGFATPEALHNLDSFRALYYMRPLSIWSLQLAIENCDICT